MAAPAAAISTHNGGGGGGSGSSSSSIIVYPYTRSEECQWQPEELARHLAALIATTTTTTQTTPSVGQHQQGGGGTATTSTTTTTTQQLSSLLSHGWDERQVTTLRRLYGSNRMQKGDNDKNNDDNGSDGRRRQRARAAVQRYVQCLAPITTALVAQLKEPMILMLLGSAAISIVLGNVADAFSIAIALLIVACVAAIQEYRSEQALEKLHHLVPHTCTVIRQSHVHDAFPARDLVVGDLLLLGTGDRVPADCRVVDSVELLLDESSLTGENHPVSKTGEGLASIGIGGGNSRRSQPLITEQQNMVFAGTLVTSGRGRALVVAVGEATEFGKVATQLSEVSSRKSPLQLKIDELSQRLAGLSTICIALIAVLGWLMGRPFLETLTVAVSLAVAAIPEGLPICVTVTLALGVLRMARRNAIVKKLPVVESLGCTTAIASDKTGTLTQNEMTVRTAFSMASPRTELVFTGVGYNPNDGRLMMGPMDENNDSSSKERRRNSPPRSGQHVVQPGSEIFTTLEPLFQTACLCNNATLVQSVDSSMEEGHTGGSLSGQPTELALLVAAEKAGISDVRPQYHRVQEIPFTSDRKRMQVRARPVSGVQSCAVFTNAVETDKTKAQRRSSVDGSLYFVKGMPEQVLGECRCFVTHDGSFQPLVEDTKTQVLTQSRRMAAGGLRVLAFAFGNVLDQLVFVGLLGMEDPPRVGVADSVRHLREGGVKVMMVTGDSKETALAIAKRCGILGNGAAGLDGLMGASDELALVNNMESGVSEALSGAELDSIPEQNLADSISGVRVFYRVVPRHKLAIVRALQELGDIVAMTGDGVNDATALKGADIGVAMGKKGTDVAKEASDVILADDDFQTITMAIAEGKGIFFNIRCFLAFQLSTSFAALSMASIATAFGMPSPLNAMQILWINIIMDGPPAQSLGVEPVDERILRAKPRMASDPIVTPALLLRAVTSAALIVFLTLRVFADELLDGKVSRRDTTMTFMTFVNCDLFNAYVCRSAERTFYELSLFSNPAFLYAVGGSVIGQLLVIYWPPLQEVFQTEALSLRDLLYIVSLSSMILVLDTVRKKFFLTLCSDGYHTSPRAKGSSLSRTQSWLTFGQLIDNDKARHQKSRGKKKKTTVLAL